MWVCLYYCRYCRCRCIYHFGTWFFSCVTKCSQYKHFVNIAFPQIESKVINFFLLHPYRSSEGEERKNHRPWNINSGVEKKISNLTNILHTTYDITEKMKHERCESVSSARNWSEWREKGRKRETEWAKVNGIRPGGKYVDVELSITHHDENTYIEIYYNMKRKERIFWMTWRLRNGISATYSPRRKKRYSLSI